MKPNWFAAVMGTGIVANAAVLLPRHAPGQHAVALGVWLLASALLAGLALVALTRKRPRLDAATAPFLGAPPMALLTVGAGTLLLGQDLIGLHAAAIVDGVLWTLGTTMGLAVAVVVPYRLIASGGGLKLDAVQGSWLMPVVPPMVSAATGAALIAHLPAGQAQLTLLLACYALFGLSLLASLLVIALLCARLALHGTGPAPSVPTLFMVLGPLGQSITAVNLLGAAAVGVTPYAPALRDFGVLYGVPVIGFTLVWLALAAALTIKARPPFSLAWWSFTFPVGTVVTGTSELARHTQATAFTYLAIALYACLVLAWLTVFPRTVALVSRSCRPSRTRSPATIWRRSSQRSRPAISMPPPTR